MHTYFLGIDNGGTMTKSALFDQSGREVAVFALDTPVLMPQDGWNERDMDELWETTCRTIRGVIKKSGVDPAAILGIGCTGHGKGLYLWGKDHKPAANAIASTDHRAIEVAQRFKKEGITEAAAAKTLQPLRDVHPVCLLRWFKENREDVYRNIQFVFEAKDYIRFRLTGEAYAEATDYSGTGLMDLHKAAFDRELLKLYGIEEVYDALPPLKNSTDLCGCITEEVAVKTGLAAGTPVCGGMFDIDACAVAMDVTTEEKLCVITGTWSINEYISTSPVSGNGSTLNSLFCIPGYYLIEESSPTSAGNLGWLMELKQEKKNYDRVNECIEALGPDDSDVIFLPFLYGSNTAISKGAFLNLTYKTSDAELYRAVFEGVAFSHKMHVDRLLELRQKPSAIRIAGGAANSQAWLHIFADVLNMPLEVVSTQELGTLGAAMAAAVCAGVYADYAHAAKQMVSYKQTIYPNKERVEIYQRKYAIYRRLIRGLEEVS